MQSIFSMLFTVFNASQSARVDPRVSPSGPICDIITTFFDVFIF